METQSEITEEQAIALAKSEFWKTMTHQQIAEFQLFTPRLCMPFGVFHEAIEKALGRPVFAYEFGLDPEGLKAELRGERAAPSFAEIIAMIPADKTALVALVNEGTPT